MRLMRGMTSGPSRTQADALISVPGKHLSLFTDLKDRDNEWAQTIVSSP